MNHSPLKHMYRELQSSSLSRLMFFIQGKYQISHGKNEISFCIFPLSNILFTLECRLCRRRLNFIFLHFKFLKRICVFFNLFSHPKKIHIILCILWVHWKWKFLKMSHVLSCSLQKGKNLFSSGACLLLNVIYRFKQPCLDSWKHYNRWSLKHLKVHEDIC